MEWLPPEFCPQGHELRPGHVVVSWVPCECRPRQGDDRHALGHRTVFCRWCAWEWREGGCDAVGEWHNTRPAPAA